MDDKRSVMWESGGDAAAATLPHHPLTSWAGTYLEKAN